jgi:serine/threonine-protein kinase
MTPRTIARYAVHDAFASGGFATLHFGRGIDPPHDLVAIKRMHRSFLADPEQAAMLLDEAWLASRVRHPNVVAMLDVVAEGGEMALVMEYVHGASLARLARAPAESARVPIAVLSSILCGVLRGLHAAHEARSADGAPLGMIHRDATPENILVGEDGIARLVDFGVAKAVGRARTTKDGRVKGKLAYMPPEQLHGEALDRRADVFAASVVLWEGLTGRRLFLGDDEAKTLARVLTMPVAAPSAIEPSVPPAVDEIVLRGLSRDREKRWATAEEMADALEAAIPPAPSPAVGAWVRAGAGELLAERARAIDALEHGAAAAVEEPRAPGRSRRRVVVLVAAGATTAGILALAGWRARGAPASTAAPEASSVATAPPPSPPATAAASAAPLGLSDPATSAHARAPAARTAPPLSTVRPGTARAGCNPPYVVDAEGHKHFKIGCLSP